MVLPQDSYLRFGPYQELMTGIRTALQINEGIVKVVAPEGSGKTAFCRKLASDLRDEGQMVVFFETPPESVDFLHQRIKAELDLPREKNFTRSLTTFLLSRQPPNNKLYLIYDDAEKISKEIFILIRLLNNIHDASETLVSQVICGSGKLDRVFDDPDLRSLTQYLNQSFSLPPMTHDELVDFSAAYMKLSGLPNNLSNKDITDIFMVGKGMPGKSLELLEKHTRKRPAGADPTVSAAGNLAGAPAPEPPPRPPAIDDEVAQVLKEPLPRQKREAIFFKSVVAMIILISSVILMVILSREKEANPNRLAEILADDSPLYLDEVEDMTVAETEPEPLSSEETGTTTPLPAVDDVRNEQVATAAPEPVPVAAENPGIRIADPEPLNNSIEAIAASNATEASRNNTDSDMGNSTAGNIANTTAMQTAAETVTAGVAPVADSSAIGTDLVAASEAVREENTETTLAAETPATTGANPVSELPQTIQSWLDHWQRGNFAGYLAAYHPDFEPAYHDSRSLWENERQSRIDGVTGIMVSFDRFSVEDVTQSSATARFWLHYTRGSYADDTLKEIIFRHEEGKWLILSERNLELIVR